MNGNISRCLKAPTQPITDLATLQHRLPLYASDKEDGIRCIIHPLKGCVSQTMKPIPNKFVRSYLEEFAPWCSDGELVCVDLKGMDLGFNDTQSGIMSEEGKPNFRYRIFDLFENQYLSYEERGKTALWRVLKANAERVTFLHQTFCKTLAALEMCEESALARGKEGIMLRHPQGWYKEGRSTLNEAYLLKVKRFMDDEALVIGIEEEMENCNPATRDAGGLQRRSKHVAGMRKKKTVGKLLCLWNGLSIKVSGGTHEQKKEWWTYPSEIIGKTITFRYQAHGMKILPRCPTLKGIRQDV